MTTIEQELQYNHEQHPGYLERFLTLMNEGKIDGDDYHIGENGCFYGHLFWNNEAMFHTWNVREELIGDRWSDTPIEQLIVEVRPGDTPQDTPALWALKDAITQLLATSPS